LYSRTLWYFRQNIPSANSRLPKKYEKCAVYILGVDDLQARANDLEEECQWMWELYLDADAREAAAEELLEINRAEAESCAKHLQDLCNVLDSECQQLELQLSDPLRRCRDILWGMWTKVWWHLSWRWLGFKRESSKSKLPLAGRSDVDST